MISDESFQEEGRKEVQQQFRAMKYESDTLSVSMAVKDVSSKSRLPVEKTCYSSRFDFQNSIMSHP